jgi:hypothetical protein
MHTSLSADFRPQSLKIRAYSRYMRLNTPNGAWEERPK